MTNRLDFVSMGMFILDDIKLEDGEVMHDLVGGAGTYAAIGARIVSSAQPTSVGLVVDYGRDIPEQVVEQMNCYGFDLDVRRDTTRLTTRGWNEYSGSHRKFSFMTEKKRLEVSDLPERYLDSASYHLICAPKRCLETSAALSKRWTERQGNLDDNAKPPIFVWEPAPDWCTPENWPMTCQAMRKVDVVSPNMSEAANLLGIDLGDPTDRRDEEKHLYRVAEMAQMFVDCGAKIVVIRCGAHGSYTLVYQATIQTLDHNMSLTSFWTSAIFGVESGQEGRVVDATGAGNAFCGALAISLARGHDLRDATVNGATASSFVIEQFGLPKLSLSTNPCCNDWNGITVEERRRAVKLKFTKKFSRFNDSLNDHIA